MLTKAKSLIPKTAKNLNVSEDLVTDVVNHYYTTLRKKMESLDHPRIYVVNLGVFYTSKSKLRKSIERLKFLLSDQDEKNFKKVAKFRLNENQILKQEELLNKIMQEEHEQSKHKNNIQE